MCSTEWQAVRQYRNLWVHGKPPIVKKWGHQFNGELQWKEVRSETRQLTVRAGSDPPDWEIEQLVDTVTRTVFQVVQATEAIVDFYLEKIEPYRRQSFVLSILSIEAPTFDQKV